MDSRVETTGTRRTRSAAGDETCAADPGSTVRVAASGEAACAPAIRPNMVSAVRTLRVLQILQEQTDDVSALTANDIAAQLRAPGPAGAPSIIADCKAVYTSITCLRALGHDVRNRGRQGYALIGRPLTDTELAAAIGAIESAPNLSLAQASLLCEKLLSLGTPSLRREVRAAHERAAKQDAASARNEVSLICRSIDELCALAIEAHAEIELEVASDRGPLAGATGSNRNTPTQAERSPALPDLGKQAAVVLRMTPAGIVERAGNRYLRGFAADGEGRAATMRAFRLERIRSARARLADGTRICLRPETAAPPEAA